MAADNWFRKNFKQTPVAPAPSTPTAQTAQDSLAVKCMGCQEIIFKKDFERNINVFPNPGSSMIHIAAPVSVNIAIMSTDGRIVIKQQDATDVNVVNLASGMYMIMIYDENNKLLKNQKFTKVE